MSLSKRSISIAGHRTSIALEPLFWQVLEQLAAQRGLTLPALVAEIDASRTGPLASAMRLAALETALSGRAPETEAS